MDKQYYKIQVGFADGSGEWQDLLYWIDFEKLEEARVSRAKLATEARDNGEPYIYQIVLRTEKTVITDEVVE